MNQRYVIIKLRLIGVGNLEIEKKIICYYRFRQGSPQFIYINDTKKALKKKKEQKVAKMSKQYSKKLARDNY